MIDIFLLAEILWCTVVLGTKPLPRTLLYIGGFMASGYVATQSSAWITRTFATHAKTAFAWFSQHVANETNPVGLIGTVIPPEATFGGGVAHEHWIAMHILQALLSSAITVAVFMVFIVIAYLATALWDGPSIKPNWTNRLTAQFLGLGCGCYIAALSGIALANLSWLDNFQPIGPAVAQSVLLGQLNHIMSMTNQYFH